ncbi:MAG TPA: TlpA disulfide reductase family protein [Allosphingosinicella sp.]|jgi:thiol-disulfide isomerase/thioredoxin
MRNSLLLGLLLLTACGSETPAPQAEPAKAGAIDRSRAGTAAPDTSFEDPDGEKVTLADFRGKPVLLNLWATWCAPCVKELPTLDALQTREGERLKVLTVSQDMEGRAKVEAFLAKGKYRSLEAWLDAGMALMSDLGVTTLPTTILYDAQGREVWRLAGDKDWTGTEAAGLIAQTSSR